MAIVTIMPTRGRPERACEAVISHNETAAFSDSIICAVMDKADPKREDYRNIFLDEDVDLFMTEGSMVKRSNEAAMRYATEGAELIGWSADDQLFRTPGWDHRVKSAFLDPSVAFVMTNDLHYGAEKAVNIYTRPEIIKSLGWFLEPNLSHLYVDVVWVDLGRASNSLVYLEDVVVEHMHPVYGKGPNDQQYQTLHEPKQYAIDFIAYEKWKAAEMNEDVRKVNECLTSLSR